MSGNRTGTWEELRCFWLQAAREVGAKPSAGAAVSSEYLTVAEACASRGCRRVDPPVGLLGCPHLVAPTSRSEWSEENKAEAATPGKAQTVTPAAFCGSLTSVCFGRGQYKGTGLRKRDHWGPSWRLATMVTKTKCSWGHGQVEAHTDRWLHSADLSLSPASWELGVSLGHMPGRGTVVLFV